MFFLEFSGCGGEESSTKSSPLALAFVSDGCESSLLMGRLPQGARPCRGLVTFLVCDGRGKLQVAKRERDPARHRKPNSVEKKRGSAARTSQMVGSQLPNEKGGR